MKGKPMTMFIRIARISVLAAGAAICGAACVMYDLPIIPDAPKPPVVDLVTLESIKAGEEAKALERGRLEAAAKNAYISDLALQPKVTNVFVEVDIRSALLDISTQTGVNIVPDSTVEGTVSADLKGAPLETALRILLSPGGFTFRKVDDYYIVGLAEPENKNFKILSETRVVRTNIPAAQVKERISSYFRPYFSINEQSGNIITMTGPPEIINRLEEDIRKVDVPKRQIEISAVVVDVQWEKGRNIGTEWGDLTLTGKGTSDTALNSGPTLTGNFIGALAGTIRTLDRKAKFQIKASPSVVASEGDPAEIRLTQEHYFLILSGGGFAYYYYTSQKIDVGVILKVTPFINRDGDISLNIEPEVSDVIGEREFKIGDSNQKLPIINRRTEKTIVTAKNGQRITIGGLFLETDKVVDRRLGIPIIGDLLANIPILNFFFRGVETMEKDSEMVIFITPRIIG
jgi:type II secretory pathway component GspD/PulD (secretin)